MRGAGPVHKRIRQAALVGSLLVIAIGTLRPLGGADGGLAPLCLPCRPMWASDFVLNILLFVPLGLLLRLYGARPGRASAWAMALSLAIELLQYGFIAGRFASVWDVVANTIGGTAGALLPVVGRIAANRNSACRVLAAVLVIGWWTLASLTAWSSAPDITNDVPYHALWAHEFPKMGRFEARLESVQVNGIVAPDGPLSETAAIQARLRATGVRLSARASGIQGSGTGAQVLGIVDSRQRFLAALMLEGCALTLRVRTRAERIGLASPAIASPHACAAPGERVDIEAVQDGSELTLTTRRSDGAALTRSRRLDPSLGWALFVPFALGPVAMFAGGASWTLLYSAVVGFFITGWSRASSTALILLGSLALTAGLVVPAATWHRPFPSPATLVAIVVGVVIAVVLGRRWQTPRRPLARGASV